MERRLWSNGEQIMQNVIDLSLLIISLIGQRGGSLIHDVRLLSSVLFHF